MNNLAVDTSGAKSASASGADGGVPTELSIGNYRRTFKTEVAEVSHSADPEIDLTHLNPRGPHRAARYLRWRTPASNRG